MLKFMSLPARREMLASIREKYQLGNWEIKNQLLDGFIAATGYDRKHAIKLLNGNVKLSSVPFKKRSKSIRYDEPVIQALKMLWHVSHQICSKRLVPFLPELVETLERHGHLSLTQDVKRRVLSVSPATLDRLLQEERIKNKTSISATRAGSLLRDKIRVRTFADWNEKSPGFFEADLVAHCGESTMGVFLNTLVMTDIVTGWTECIGLIRKTAGDVILGLNTVRQLAPFKILGFDVDNGCEFINYEVMSYCEKNAITFTRSRAYKKNDQAHVEQKNGSIVRRLIGYDRYETEAAWEAMCNLYAVLRLYINFFQPSLKLLKKTRQGCKTIKKYDKAKTPYQRLLMSEHILPSVKDQLTQQYMDIDPIILKEKIGQLQNQLWKHAWKSAVIPVIDELNLNEKDQQETYSETPRLYRRTKRLLCKRYWRTRKDPFEAVQEWIKMEIQLKPSIIAKEILNKLMEKYPHDFYKGHLRSLQRRVSEIRIQQDDREEKYQRFFPIYCA